VGLEFLLYVFMVKRTTMSKHTSAIEYRIGIFILLIGIPLLIWQAFPANQQGITETEFLAIHNLMETFSIIVSALIFFTVYGTRDTTRSLKVIVLGSAFLGAALFDTFHFLSYIGMPDFFSPNSPNKSILFWLAARIMVGIGILLYVIWPWQSQSNAINYQRTLSITLIIVLVLSLTILFYPHALPTMFTTGVGLSDIKIMMEWLVFGMYLLSAGILYRKRHSNDKFNIKYLMLALMLMAFGELFFTIYTHVSNTANLLGHVYKVFGYYFLYRAIFSETVRQPFQQIQKMLSHDELTGLPSRAAFQQRLEQTIEAARREESTCSVLLLGLDHFKTVNATLGHERGDLLLMAVAERIRNSLPASAFVARFSGDMFSILLKNGDIKMASRLGKILLTAMEDEFNLGADVLEIGASVGVVSYPHDGDSVSVLLRNADVSLHKAKSEGRNCMVLFSKDLSETINRHALVESRMKHALDKNEFSLHFQPKIDIGSGQIDGWEALLRWNSPELGTVSPAEFIPVAEQSGLILQIGDWVLRQASRQAAEWKREGYLAGAIAVNLSARQFRQKDLPDKIKTFLHDASIDPADITLEITESDIMDNPSMASAMLDDLKRVGIYAAIDDFGTGHSSLNYLKTFPISWLKIDRSFIRDIPNDENDVAIVRSIISLGHSLGLKVIAEGVETMEQYEYLRSINCDAIQGYYYSRPLPPDECLEFMAARRKAAS
jgi:diguanylate cyclase (GGDEF)-like protein